MPAATDLSRNLAAVRARIAAAALRAGRPPAGVTLVAVTKSVGVDVVLALARLGLRDFGENRPQDLAEKRRAFESAAAADPALRGVPVRWHMIGHFQRNKVRRTLDAMDLVHSIDSEELAATVSAEAVRAARPPVQALLQVNVSGESSKGGLAPEAVGDVIRRVAALPGLRVAGLMTLAPWSDDPETARPVFRGLRELRDWAASSGYLSASGLSMGMSEDFEVAIEEGATIVRIGRALVGAVSA